MGFFSRLLGVEQRSSTFGINDLVRLFTSGAASKAGPAVSVNSALGVATVIACARVLAEDTSGLPCGIYQRQGGIRLPLDTDPVQALIDWPNEWQTGEELREQLTLHAVLTGNGVAMKTTVRGEVRELLPLHPSWYTIAQNGDWSLVYKVSLPDGTSFTLKREDVLHLRGPSWGGYAGMDMIRTAREAIGLAMATEASQASLHKNGVRTSGLYSVEGNLDEPAYNRLKAYIETAFVNADAYKPMIGDRGAKYTPFTMSGVDAQHIETRKHQIEEICRFMRVFPQMVGHSDKTATFASAEQFFLAHVKYSLLPWVKRWENTIRRDLIGRKRPAVYARHNVAALERADIKTRYEAYQAGINGAWMLRSDARELEDMPPVAGMERPTLPVNVAVLDADGNPPAVAPVAGGGGQTRRGPFDGRAFDPGQPRDKGGRWTSLGSFIASVIGAPPTAKLSYHRIGGVSNAAAAGAVLGRDVSDFSRAMDSFGIRHAISHHGSAAKEAARGQVALTSADFALVPSVVGHPDHLTVATTKRGLQSLTSVKTIAGHVLTVTEEVRPGQRRLVFLTMFKRKV